MITNEKTRTFILILSLILSLAAVFLMYKSVWKNLLSQPIPESKKQVVGIEKPTDLKFFLDENTKDILRKIPADKRANFNSAMAKFKKSIQNNNILDVNDKASDFKLIRKINLYNVLSEKNVVLMWYWGKWSSYCGISFSSYTKMISKIDTNEVKVIVITPETDLNLLKNDDVEIIVDKNNEIARKFGLVFDVPAGIKDFFSIKNEVKQLPLPAVYVIDRQGVIRYAFADLDLKHRAEPTEILDVIKNITVR